MSYLGWYDPDRKKSSREKVEHAVERYVEKFGAAPDVVVVGPMTTLDEAAVGLMVQTRSFIPANTFYIGVEEG